MSVGQHSTQARGGFLSLGRLLSGAARRERAVEQAAGVIEQASDLRLHSASETLIELGGRRGGERAWETLAKHLHRMSDVQRERVIAAGGAAWGDAAQRLAADSVPAHRVAATRLAGWADRPEAVMALASLLGDREANVQAAACTTLTALVRRATSGVGVDGELRSAIESCVFMALEDFDRHRRPEVLWCAFQLEATPARRRASAAALRGWLEASDHLSHLPARGALRSKSGGEWSVGAGTGVQLLATNALGSAAGERVLQSDTRREFEEILSNAHLLLNPRRARAWAKAVRAHPRLATTMLSDERFVEPDSADAARQVVTVLRESGKPTIEGLGVGLLIDQRERVRYSLVRWVIEGGEHADVLLDAAHDASERVAQSSLACMLTPSGLARVGRAQVGGVCRSLLRSPHQRVRELATVAASGLGELNPDDVRSRLVTRRMFKRDPEGAALRLRERVLVGSLSERIGAVRMLAAIGEVERGESEMLAIVRNVLDNGRTGGAGADADEFKVAATCVSAMGLATSSASMEALLGACGAPNERVRANAIDAILRRLVRRTLAQSVPGEVLDCVVERRQDTHHRVKSSALLTELLGRSAVAEKSAVRPRDGGAGDPAGGIIEMLSDPRPMHRIAGLWAAERASSHLAIARGSGFEGAIAGLVNADPSEEVRRRARQSAARMLARAAM